MNDEYTIRLYTEPTGQSIVNAIKYTIQSEASSRAGNIT